MSAVTQRAPRAVRERAERARQISAQLVAQQGATMQRPVQQAPVQQIPTTDQQAPPVEGTEVVAPQGEVEQTGEGMEPTKVPMDDFKTRYSNLRKSRDEKREAAIQRAADLEAEIARLKAEGVAPQKSAPEAPSQSQVSEETPVVEERPSRSLADLTADFFDDVASIIPDWEAINKSAGFIQWLAADDGFSGRTRQETLSKARDELDAKTVTNLFGSYAREQASLTVKPDVDSQGSERVSNEQGNPPVSVEPGRGSAQANPGSAGEEAPYIDRATIKQFYDTQNRLIRSKKMTPELKAKFDAQVEEIKAAQLAGRIR